MAWIDGVGLLTQSRPIPKDLTSGSRAKLLRVFDDLLVRSRFDQHDLNATEILGHILRYVEIDLLLKTLGNAFASRTIMVGTAPTEVIPQNQFPRGYVLINPNGYSTIGVLQSVTALSNQIFPVGTTNSPSISSENYLTARVFLDITALGGASTLSVNIQTRDRVSGNWATAQSDIFGGFAAIGTRYAYLGENGVDEQMRIQMAVGIATVTAGVGVVFKHGQGTGATSGLGLNTVFLGHQDVNLRSGIPLTANSKEAVYLMQNTALWGIAEQNLPLRVFDLQ